MVEAPKKYKSTGTKAVIIVVVIGIIAYTQLRSPTLTPEVTTATTTPSSVLVSSISQTLASQSSQTSVGQSSGLQASDFHITNDKGCVYTDASGRIVASYALTITNRLNESFRLAGGTIMAVLALQNSSRINIPAIQVLASSVSAPKITISVNLAVAGTGFENGKAVSVVLSGWVRVQGVSDPIPVSLQTVVPSVMANC